VARADDAGWEHAVELEMGGEPVRLWIQKTD
jgi:hypothetical protein